MSAPNLIKQLQGQFPKNLQVIPNLKPDQVVRNLDKKVKPFMPTIQVPDTVQIVEEVKDKVAETFLDREEMGGRAFSTTITNSGQAAKQVIIFPGLLKGASSSALARYGLGNAVILKEGTAGTNILVDSEEAPIDILQNYIIENPILLKAIQVSSTSPTQNTTAFRVQHLTPWSRGDDRNVRPADSLNQYADNERYVVFDANIVLSEQVALIYRVNAQTDVKLTFYFGPSLSKAQALARKVFNR